MAPQTPHAPTGSSTSSLIALQQQQQQQGHGQPSPGQMAAVAAISHSQSSIPRPRGEYAHPGQQQQQMHPGQRAALMNGPGGPQHGGGGGPPPGPGGQQQQQQGPGPSRVIMLNGGGPVFGGPQQQQQLQLQHSAEPASNPLHPHHQHWRAHQHPGGFPPQQQQPGQQQQYARPNPPPLMVQTNFPGGPGGPPPQHPGQPNGMLPSPLPLPPPTNSRPPPLQQQQQQPGARAPQPLLPPNPNHPGAPQPGGPPQPYRQPGPPPPAPPPGSQGPPPPNQPMRQPTAPPPAGNGGPPPPPVDPRVAAQLAHSGTGPITASPSPVGPALAKLTALYDSLHRALESEDIEPLRQTVAEFFTETGILKYALFDKKEQLSKVFEIPCSAFPRFQHINAISGVIHSGLTPSLVREFFLTTPDPSSGRPAHVGYLLKAEHTTWFSNFSSGVKVDLVGSLTVHFVVTGQPGGLRVESIEFTSRGHEEYVGREGIARERVERFYEKKLEGEEREKFEREEEERAREEEEERRKREREKGKKPGAATRRRSQTKESEEAEEEKAEIKRGLEVPTPGLTAVRFERAIFPTSPVGSFGITEMGMRCLEIAESVAQLQDLIGYSLDTNVGPIEALSLFANQRPRHPSHLSTIASSSQNPSTNSFYSSVGTTSPKRKATPDDGQGASEYSAISVSPNKMARGASNASAGGRGRGRGQRGMG